MVSIRENEAGETEEKKCFLGPILFGRQPTALTDPGPSRQNFICNVSLTVETQGVFSLGRGQHLAWFRKIPGHLPGFTDSFVTRAIHEKIPGHTLYCNTFYSSLRRGCPQGRIRKSPSATVMMGRCCQT